jgi:hypothetical protein
MCSVEDARQQLLSVDATEPFVPGPARAGLLTLIVVDWAVQQVKQRATTELVSPLTAPFGLPDLQLRKNASDVYTRVMREILHNAIAGTQLYSEDELLRRLETGPVEIHSAPAATICQGEGFTKLVKHLKFPKEVCNAWWCTCIWILLQHIIA